ncbi:hypothetical protein N8482_00030 [Chitinophagales bacterium]|nr:hypothetical protein [Chitinophagales bacterium]
MAIRKSVWSAKSNSIAIAFVVWLIAQAILSYSLFYLNTVGLTPPPFSVLGFIPTFVLMIYIFNSKSGKQFIDSLPLFNLTFLSIVRIPVEIVLWWLFLQEAIPEMMTFEGRNWDILAGITAPFIAYLGYKKSLVGNGVLLAWNVICLILLLNIVIHAMFSFPTAFQQLNLDNPNVGILYFPFFWLPSFVVPVVMFTHFVSIRRLIYSD